MRRYKRLGFKIITWRKEIIAALIVGLCTMFPCIFQYHRANVEHKKAKYYVSGGQAVGYFYNFIYELFEKDSIKVGIFSLNKDSLIETKIFSRKNIKIKVLVPSKLTLEKIQLINREASKYRKGTIFHDGKRDKTIHFEQAGDSIIIYDAANPLNAVRKYIENIPEFKSGFDSSGRIFDATITDEYNQRSNEEIENFENTITHFVNREETKPIIGENIIQFIRF